MRKQNNYTIHAVIQGKYAFDKRKAIVRHHSIASLSLQKLKSTIKINIELIKSQKRNNKIIANKDKMCLIVYMQCMRTHFIHLSMYV